MKLKKRFLLLFFRALTRILCRVDDAHLTRVPMHGPLIIISNHINILEAPVLFTHLYPRPLTGFVAAYRWDAAWTRWLLETSEAIPIHRGSADVMAMRRALEALRMGYLLAIAPEGTRSQDGRLMKAHPGMVSLAHHSQAPLLPIACYGHEGWTQNLRRLRRTPFHFAVGDLIQLNLKGTLLTKDVRRRAADEIMYHLATLLPPSYRGAYHDLSLASEELISRFPKDAMASTHR
jgi:1-acyl-sn-glycerol-3-phosphate acyltransferase